MKLTYKKAITFFLVFIIVISYQAVFISCGDTAGVKDYKVIILDKSELELREVYSIECNGKSDAWIGGYILSGKPFPDKVEKASLGSVNRQYYKITEKVYDMVNGKYLNTTVPSEAIYATPAYMTEYNMPLYVGGISLFKLQFNCLVTTEAGEEKLAFSLSDQEIREAIESALGSTYAWDTFNKFEIQFIEELKEDFASSLGAGTAKAIWSTEYNGCEVENRLEITLQFADVDDEKGLLFREETSIIEVNYINAFLHTMKLGNQPNLYDMKIDIPNEEMLLGLFNSAAKYVPNLLYNRLDFSAGMQITSYEGYPCIYVPVILVDGTFAPDKEVSMIIFI